ncbi:hypothetical protein GY515_000906 [Escherichia coli]|nr:hypothetical protein [Escherichia coli]EFI3634451.1 hypothetical protein [Escherichia coli]
MRTEAITPPHSTQPGRELAERNALAQIPDLLSCAFNHEYKCYPPTASVYAT